MTTKTTGQPGDLVMGGATEWVLVPAAATDHMIQAFSDTAWVSDDKLIHGFRDAYKSMLAAAPTPPAEAQAVGGGGVPEVVDVAMREYELAAYRHGQTDENAVAVDAAADNLKLIIAALSAQPRQEADSLPRYRVKGALGATYLAADAEGDLCKYADVHRSAFFTALVAEKSAQPSSAPVGVDAGIEVAARYVDQRREDYDSEHGSTDPETGTREYPGTGDEYVGELEEIAEGIRALAQQPAATLQEQANALGYTMVENSALALLERQSRTAIACERGELWYWQGDGADFPDSLSCPVVMHPNTLRELLAAQQPAAEQDDRFPGGFADAIRYADSMEAAAGEVYELVFGYENDGSDTGTDMLRAIAQHLQQPAAVDEAMVERAALAIPGTVSPTLEGAKNLARVILSAALAQPQGASHDQS